MPRRSKRTASKKGSKDSVTPSSVPTITTQQEETHSDSGDTSTTVQQKSDAVKALLQNCFSQRVPSPSPTSSSFAPRTPPLTGSASPPFAPGTPPLTGSESPPFAPASPMPMSSNFVSETQKVKASSCGQKRGISDVYEPDEDGDDSRKGPVVETVCVGGNAASSKHHAVCVIIPYRKSARDGVEREMQLQVWQDTILPQLENEVEKEGHRRGLSTSVHLFITEQTNSSQTRFNRGALLNIGFLAAEAIMKKIEAAVPMTMTWNPVLHDVDLVPSRRLMREYLFTHSGYCHLASTWKKYSYPTFLGGVLTMDPATFKAINGFPCSLFGWGGEDDALQMRLTMSGCPRHDLQLTDTHIMDMQEETGEAHASSIPSEVCLNKKDILRSQSSTWLSDGLSTTAFQPAAKPHLTYDAEGQLESVRLVSTLALWPRRIFGPACAVNWTAQLDTQTGSLCLSPDLVDEPVDSLR